MKEESKYITVLDFEAGKVWQYTLMGEGWNPDYEACEDYLTSKGHNLTNCEWMVHEDAKKIAKMTQRRGYGTMLS